MEEDRLQDARRPVRCWTLDDYHLQIGGALIVSFQRSRQRIDPSVGGTQNFGALPIAVDLRPSPTADILVPLKDTDALWLGLRAISANRPVAVRIAIETPDRLDALTGSTWTDHLDADPQNYVVCPPQIEVHGLQSGPKCARQFTRSAQSDLAIACKRIELVAITSVRNVRAPTPGSTRPTPVHEHARTTRNDPGDCRGVPQQILRDPYGVTTWDDRQCQVSIALVSSEEFSELTGAELLAPLDAISTYGGWRLP